MSQEAIDLTCPYCGEEFNIKFPAKKDQRGHFIEGETLGAPNEVACMPYTRDVGRFDPKSEEDWYDNKKWSRIGSDFLPTLSWERIGVLRLTRGDINIQYRVQHCPACEGLFDVYANYTEDKTSFKTLWPHLFSPDARLGIKPYHGLSWFLWLIKAINDRLKSNTLGAILIGLFIFFWGIIPTYTFSNYLYLIDGNFYDRLWLYGAACVFVITILLLEDHYVKYLQLSKEFDQLFDIELRKGIIHWKNYTLCRFVGVQQEGKLPQPTQVDIVSGGISIALMLVAWTSMHLKYLGFLLACMAGVALIFLGRYFLGRWTKKIQLRRIAMILAAASLIGLGAWFTLGQGLKVLGEYILVFSDLVFWLLVVYFIGTAALLAMNIALYVLQGLTRIRMTLNPYNGYKEAKPLHTLRRYSLEMNLVLFIAILAFTSLLINMPTYTWLLYWMLGGVAIIFIAVGLGLNNGEFVTIALIYSLLQFFTWGKDFWSGSPSLPVSISWQIVNLGIFFTLLVGYQILRVEGTVNGLLEKAKNKEIDRLNEHLEILRDQITKIESHIIHSPSLKPEETAHLYTEQKAVSDLVTSILSLKDRLEKVPTSSQLPQRVATLLAPLLSSIALPVAEGFIMKQLGF